MYTYSKCLRATLLGSVLVIAPSALLPAWAQDVAKADADAGPAPAKKTANLSEVKVTAAKRSVLLDQKQDAPGVVDGISSAEIRKVPNATIAQALIHVAGVSVTPNNDNERGRNSAQNPAIRGLDSKYNNVTVDGLPLATANFTGTGVSSRSTPLDVLPATLVKEIEVYKTYSPDRDPQSIGGGIELTTRSAFDNGGAPFLQLMAKTGYNSQHGEPVSQNPVNYNGDVVFSRVFGQDRQFGFVLSATAEHTKDDTYDNATTDSGYYNFYNAAGKLVANPGLSNGLAVPQQSKAWIIEESNKKADLTTKFEFKPNDQISTFLTLGHYYDANDATRNENILTPGGVLTKQTATTGSYSAGDVEVGGQYSPLKRTTNNAQMGLSFRVTDEDVVDVRAGDSYSKWLQPQFMVKFINRTINSPTKGSVVAADPSNAFNYNLYDDYSNFNMNPSVFSNPSNYGGFYWRYRNRTIKTGDQFLRLDYAHNADADSQGLGFKVGGNLQRTSNSLAFRSPEFDPNITGTVTLAGLQQPSSYKIPNYTNLPFLLIDVDKAFAFLQNNPSLFHNTNQNTANNGNNFDLHERVGDAYAMAVYNTSNVHAMLGLRTDSANVDVTGNQLLPIPPGVVVSGLAGSPYPAYQPIRTRSDYSNPLPAGSISYAPMDTVQLRAAYSRTIGRPDYSDYSPSSAISQDPSTGILTVSQGNPNLKPRLSSNYDVAAEWYFEPDSMISVATFYKNISNEIFSVATNGTAVFNGVSLPAVITQPVNATSSSLKGLELQFIHDNYGELLPWLEGVGTSVNYTLLRGHAEVPSTTGLTRTIDGLVNQPKYIGNATVSYQHGDLLTALAYNATGKSLRQITANAYWQDVYWTPHQQLDMKLTYFLRSDLQMTAEVQNITNDTVKSVTGPDRNLLKDQTYVGRTFWLGFVYRPTL